LIVSKKYSNNNIPTPLIYKDGFALQFVAVIVIARDGNWAPSHGEVYAIFVCCVLLHGFLATVGARIMGKLQTVFVVMNLILVAGTIIALPIGTGSKRNDAKYVFATTEVGYIVGSHTSPC